MKYARTDSEASLWVALLEKAWAKVNGNFQFISGGWFEESTYFLTSAFSSEYKMGDTAKNMASARAVWQKAADNCNGDFICGSNVVKTNSLTLPYPHAYTVLSTHIIKESTGVEKVRLLKVRNPWGNDVDCKGLYCDNASFWTNTAYAKQVNFVKNTYDGDFFVSETEFYNTFDGLMVTEYWKNYTNSIREVLNSPDG